MVETVVADTAQAWDLYCGAWAWDILWGEVALAAEAQEVLEAEVLEASAADLSAEVVHPDPGSTLELNI